MVYFVREPPKVHNPFSPRARMQSPRSWLRRHCSLLCEGTTQSTQPLQPTAKDAESKKLAEEPLQRVVDRGCLDNDQVIVSLTLA